ncbi:MAG: SMI1/KNR4 family protein [Blastomonas fulva]|uniref:SMI1/KNR4 family protein n=1 Tax=Blastomonas fulva TaxID=1550728 RepID=UPI004033A11A
MDRTRRNLLIGGLAVGMLALGGLLREAIGTRRHNRRIMTEMTDIPERPAGNPKPMLEEDIAPVLARLDAWFAANLPLPQHGFNPPATEAQIDEIEQLMGLKLPQSYRDLYRWHDGENDGISGHIYGLPLLPLHQVMAEHQSWQDALEGIDGDAYAIPGGSWPEGAVDPAYINLRWLPLTGDGGGNSIGLDFDPWPAGRVGQVIIFGRDEEVKVVLAQSLGQFLEWIAGLLESGNFELVPIEGEEPLHSFQLKEPSIEHFHDAARALLGAPDPYV